jgi:NOL1/NOP2/fmu family ribosome biogenesis protein
MQTLKILNSKERKNIAKLISQQFGFEFKFKYEVFINPKNKIYILNKDVSLIDLEELRVNSLGMYFAIIYDEKYIRLSIEGSQLIGHLAKKNVLELNNEDAHKWMSGEDFELDTELQGFVIIKHENDYLGCGKVFNKKLYNYVQKERRV